MLLVKLPQSAPTSPSVTALTSSTSFIDTLSVPAVQKEVIGETKALVDTARGTQRDPQKNASEW